MEKMKNILYNMIMFAAVALTAVSCDNRNMAPVSFADVRVNVMLDGQPFPDNATVTLRAQHHSTTYSNVSRGGFARFSVPVGQYNVSVFSRESIEDEIIIYNGSASVVLTSGQENSVVVNLVVSRSSQLVIKELYVGGCQKDDGSGAFSNDKYVILYNNGDTEFDASDICFAFTAPENSNSTSRYLVNGELSYVSEGWIPAMYAIWWFETDVVIPPYSQIVVSINGAVDHTATYSNSVNLSKAEYYVMYDPESGMVNADSYPAPSSNIPSSHYLQTYLYISTRAWAISNSGPGFFIIDCHDIETVTREQSYYDYTYGGTRPNLKVPEDWVVDAIEVFRTDYENNKRFPSTMDAGYVYHRNQQGYTLYRNVDQASTEALPENEGKLVYGYSGGTTDIEPSCGTTDPSGIDAEASIANGAHIIYQDTNNSSNDFHLRAKASLRY